MLLIKIKEDFVKHSGIDLNSLNSMTAMIQIQKEKEAPFSIRDPTQLRLNLPA